LLDDAAPMTMRVAVTKQRGIFPARPCLPIGQEHLVSMIHGPEDFAVCDLAASFTYARLTQAVAADSAYVRYHFLDPAVYLMAEAARFCPVHASCIALNGRAVLLCGESGAGKTSLAYACAKRGWTFLSGDATYIVRDTSEAIVAGRPHSIRFRAEARRLFPELGVYLPERRPNGKLDLELDTKELGLDTAFRSKACAVVFLNRKSDERPATIASFPRANGFMQLSQAICYGNTHIRTAQKTALLNFLELPALELTYTDFDRAEQVLRVLASGRP
jgi:hypothetical protein